MTSRHVALIAIIALSFVHTVPVRGHAALVNPALVASVGIATQPQALNPPYLSEMPTVDRVMHAMQTADPRETAWRQMGAFYELMEIIKALSGHREYTQLKFRTPVLYGHVRHPLYLGWLFAFWATPTMTVAHLVFAIATTVYILIAIQFEEKDLVSLHGDEYRRYQKRVPMIVPLRIGKALAKTPLANQEAESA